MSTATLIQQMREALCTAHALLFGSRPHGQADIDMLRAASRQGIAAADHWLAGQPAGNRPSTPLHITGPDGRSLRVTRQYWHEGVLCVATEAWPEPRTMTVEDLADCGLLSELDGGAGPS